LPEIISIGLAFSAHASFLSGWSILQTGIAIWLFIATIAIVVGLHLPQKKIEETPKPIEVVSLPLMTETET